jgi:hypothetical protein
VPTGRTGERGAMASRGAHGSDFILPDPGLAQEV